MSQKIYAIFNRKTLKGRDFYDAVFLFSLARPNYDYLKMKLGIDNGEMLKKKLLDFCWDLNFEELSADVEPFLFRAQDVKKVELFKEFISSFVF